MIFDTHTNAKVIGRTYRDTLARADIDRTRCGPDELRWLDIPPAVGTGKYDDGLRGWMTNPDWRGSAHRMTTADLPVTKRRSRWPYRRGHRARAR